MFVGARPWQILKHEPSPEVDPELEVPIDIELNSDFFGDEYEGEDSAIQFTFNELWTALPLPIKRIATMVALDMAAGMMLQETFYLNVKQTKFGQEGTQLIQTIADSTEKLLAQVIERPYKRIYEHSGATELQRIIYNFRNWKMLYPQSEPRPSWFTVPITAITHIMDIPIGSGDDEFPFAILLGLSGFSCYGERAPLGRTGSLAIYFNEYVSDMTHYIYSSMSPEMAIGIRDCMEPWINIWWQEVLDVLAFVIPEYKGRVFRAR